MTKTRDPWETSEGEPALITAVTLFSHVQKPLLSWNACANRNQEFLASVFDFVQSIGRSVTADRKYAGSGDEIDVRAENQDTAHAQESVAGL